MKIWIIGSPSAGKSFLGRQLGTALNLPHTELDYIFWEPKWTIKDSNLFVDDVKSITATPSWVIDGNYTASAPILHESADILIWLNPSFLRSYRRVLSRTYQRLRDKEPICNGNYETFWKAVSRDGMPYYSARHHRRVQKRLMGFWGPFERKKIKLANTETYMKDIKAFLGTD